MLEQLNVWLALSGWLAWLAKEVGATVFRRWFARSGRIGVIERRARLCCFRESTTGESFLLDYYHRDATADRYRECQRFCLHIDFQFYNDSDVQIVYTRPRVKFVGVEGLRFTHLNPDMMLQSSGGTGDWKVVSAVHIPAHGIVDVRIEIGLALQFDDAHKEIEDRYAGTVAELEAEAIDGTCGKFRICSRSFAGGDQVIWPGHLKFPIYNLMSLNMNGHRAGRRPQPRRRRPSGQEAV